jgi:hypothetical protein
VEAATMEKSKKPETFWGRVDSIQSKFMESLVTGQRDAIFKEKKPDARESDDLPAPQA